MIDSDRHMDQILITAHCTNKSSGDVRRGTTWKQILFTRFI